MCILQTCLDFIEEYNTPRKEKGGKEKEEEEGKEESFYEKEEEEDVEIFVVCDAVSSCRPYDRSIALQRLTHLPNVTLLTAESAVFELLGSADHPKFRAVSALMKALPPEAHAFANDTTL